MMDSDWVSVRRTDLEEMAMWLKTCNKRVSDKAYAALAVAPVGADDPISEWENTFGPDYVDESE